MIQTVEAIVDGNGKVLLLGKVSVTTPCRALLTVLEEPAHVPNELAIMSEAALAVDWLRPEEDAAWAHLQSEK